MDEEFGWQEFVNDKSEVEPFSSFDNDKFLESIARLNRMKALASDMTLFNRLKPAARLDTVFHETMNHKMMMPRVLPLRPTFTMSGLDRWHRRLPTDLQERFDRFSETQRALCYLSSPEYAKAVAKWDATSRLVNWEMVEVVECLEKCFEASPNNLEGESL